MHVRLYTSILLQTVDLKIESIQLPDGHFVDQEDENKKEDDAWKMAVGVTALLIALTLAIVAAIVFFKVWRKR